MDIEAKANSKPTPSPSQREGRLIRLSIQTDFLQCIGNFLEDSVDVVKNRFIGKSQHNISHLIQIFRTLQIHFLLFFCQMVPTINLDNQTFLKANKIWNISKNWMLTTKMYTHLISG